MKFTIHERDMMAIKHGCTIYIMSGKVVEIMYSASEWTPKEAIAHYKYVVIG
ncbi:hypothetical protein L0B53_02235 [Vibrio sp. SS-MA-C1-2]|uniref:hypothetical protein n=1 Tax=Vibrio sp. SS-MA-C1-2 TaxID=2908646 RepID=UPI001F2C6948|nr:hypothetical protein [Vibrio sp. SS-MA-C1-2]UJF17609.1 hypothetical protein L0B53_02235 [Vibrio sp. SS-MA-C1-2]